MRNIMNIVASVGMSVFIAMRRKTFSIDHEAIKNRDMKGRGTVIERSIRFTRVTVSVASIASVNLGASGYSFSFRIIPK